jgi:hypothetical protein
MLELANRDGAAAKALAFAIHTAARSGDAGYSRIWCSEREAAYPR